MKQKPTQEARVKALASLSSVPTVLASTELKVNKAELAAFGCKQCSSKFGALAGSQPFCVTCGSDETEVVDDEVESIEDNTQLSSISCRNADCLTHNIIGASAAKALAGTAHCVTCGEEMPYTAPETAEDDLTETEELEASDDVADEDTDTETADDLEGGDPYLGGDSVVEGEEQPDYQPNAEGNVDVDLVDTIDGEEETELSMLVNEGVLVAFVNGVPVGKLTKQTAGINADVYLKESFSNAIGHTAGRTGVKAALKHYNFELIKASFPLKGLVAQQVKAALAEESKKVVAQLSDMKEDYRQALAIASLGLAKNFFKGKDNALKAGFVEELSNAGVRNATSVVERVFSHYSQPYITTLLATADDVLGKSLEVRNELAETLDAVNPLNEADAEEEEVVARLAGANLRPEHKKVVTASVASIRSTRDALPGGRLF